MARVRIVRPVGDVTRQNRANAATLQGTRPVTVVRPKKKDDGGCKTCDGRHCVGRCQF